jgi:hypothetical protein
MADGLISRIFYHTKTTRIFAQWVSVFWGVQWIFKSIEELSRGYLITTEIFQQVSYTLFSHCPAAVQQPFESISPWPLAKPWQFPSSFSGALHFCLNLYIKKLRRIENLKTLSSSSPKYFLSHHTVSDRARVKKMFSFSAIFRI